MTKKHEFTDGSERVTSPNEPPKRPLNDKETLKEVRDRFRSVGSKPTSLSLEYDQFTDPDTAESEEE